MGVSTNGVIVTPVKDVMAVCSVVERALNKLVRTGLDLQFPERVSRLSREGRSLYRDVDWRLTPESEGAQAYFTIRGHRRFMHVFFTCDCDHKDLGPQSLSMSMGSGGVGPLAMKTAAWAASLFGPAYFREEDTRDEINLLPHPRLDIRTALALGIVTAYTLERWAEAHLAGQRTPLGEGEFIKVFGMSEIWFKGKQGIKDPSERWKALEAGLGAKDAAFPDFWPTKLEDFGPADEEAVAAARKEPASA